MQHFLAILLIVVGITNPPAYDAGATREKAPVDVKVNEALYPDIGNVAGTKYDRILQFGDGWLDPDGNKCDTRNDILKRDMEASELMPKGKGVSSCKNSTVQAGILQDPYSGNELKFLRGSGKNKDGGVQIDHIIPLSLAWQKGADKWTQAKRVTLANDPVNLRASDGPLNMSKGDKPLGTEAGAWIPPNKAYQCEYANEYMNVLDKYGLPVTSSEERTASKLCRDDKVDWYAQTGAVNLTGKAGVAATGVAKTESDEVIPDFVYEYVEWSDTITEDGRMTRLIITALALIFLFGQINARRSRQADRQRRGPRGILW